MAIEIEWHPKWPADWPAPKRERATEALAERIEQGRFWVNHQYLPVSAEPAYALGKSGSHAAREVVLIRVGS